MKEWSSDCLGQSKVKIFLDTNILSFLVDNTYPALTEAIQLLNELCITELISSDYCKNEFVGIRKREHYLRSFVEKAQEGGKQVNFSSLLKYHNQFELDEVNFYDILDAIRSSVLSDMERITTNFGIQFKCVMHALLINVANEICLSSKISKEDSIVMVSATSPDVGRIQKSTMLLTKDADFVKWYSEEVVKADIDAIFERYGIPIPNLINIRDFLGIPLNCDHLDSQILKERIVAQFKQTNINSYLGRTVVPTGERTPKDVYAIKPELEQPIPQNAYLIVIGKELDFVYYLPNQAEFYHKNQLIENGTTFHDGADCIISARCSWVEDSFDSHDVYIDLLQELRKEGNLVFLASQLEIE